MNSKHVPTRENHYLESLSKQLIKNADDNFIKEQYKLIIDSASKISERSKDSNLIYITVCSIFTPFLIKFFENKTVDIVNVATFTCLVAIGVSICISWLNLIKAFWNINYTNYLIIAMFEKHLPTSAFSLRVQLSDPVDEKGNFVLNREKTIPYIFIVLYCILYLIFLLS